MNMWMAIVLGTTIYVSSINTESLLLFNDVIHPEFIELIIKQHEMFMWRSITNIAYAQHCRFSKTIIVVIYIENCIFHNASLNVCFKSFNLMSYHNL
ncbi:hypothetical protein V1478_001517 [Vespula squamosa]|uniref:Secreted protein n=1 Tax=Vespula squamosa TaxID=30214 RepID=A0ABD2C1P9_VESSQ